MYTRWTIYYIHILIPTCLTMFWRSIEMKQRDGHSSISFLFPELSRLCAELFFPLPQSPLVLFRTTTSQGFCRGIARDIPDTILDLHSPLSHLCMPFLIQVEISHSRVIGLTRTWTNCRVCIPETLQCTIMTFEIWITRHRMSWTLN